MGAVSGITRGIETVAPQKVMEALSRLPTSQPFERRAYLAPTALARANGRWVLTPAGQITELVPGVRYVPPELHEQIARGLVGWGQ